MNESTCRLVLSATQRPGITSGGDGICGMRRTLVARKRRASGGGSVACPTRNNERRDEWSSDRKTYETHGCMRAVCVCVCVCVVVGRGDRKRGAYARTPMPTTRSRRLTSGARHLQYASLPVYPETTCSVKKCATRGLRQGSSHGASAAARKYKKQKPSVFNCKYTAEICCAPREPRPCVPSAF